MLNDLIENNGIKRISTSHTVLFKLFPYYIGFVWISASLTLFIVKEYILAVLLLPFSFAIIFYVTRRSRMTPDSVYLDYKNKDFIFLSKKKEKTTRKPFKDLISIRRIVIAEEIVFVFNNDEKYLLPLFPFSSKSVYEEIKFILDNRIGGFLTEQVDS